MNKTVVLKVANFAWFQAIWWLVILFQNSAVLPVLGLLLIWIVFSPKRVEDIKLMSAVFLLGTVVDALLTLSGLFIFNQTEVLVSFWPIPIWLSLLWAAFAGTVYHSLTAFNGRMMIAAVVGAVFAPLSYIAGAEFGAVELGASVMLSYIFIALVWSVIFPLCFYLSNRFEAKQAQA
ncbi:DUF2878 domain-containing protein [Alteromonas sp. BL110]|uniref:DUF2878 domain-containing protein n=1 Tax=Alteromonas sp. BL110 TaxID=1714845 RepID=UPI000E4F57F3|nr:DUF2878 domain-containing protein [Alteromonas sp. BL110]AXT40480.1 DUF2878 domain-containing protein [Alteromonas sp. BL110]RKM79714.1 DUF2878 family protein [Alteromonas sp. BL110]